MAAMWAFATSLNLQKKFFFKILNLTPRAIKKNQVSLVSSK
jgi:hypothetical protein